MKTRTHCVKNPSFSIPLRRLSPTPSSVLIPVEYLVEFEDRMKELSLKKRDYLTHLLKAFRVLILTGSIGPSDKLKCEYQKPEDELKKINFRPREEDWAELKNLANFMGMSMCNLFVLILRFDLIGMGDVIMRHKLFVELPTMFPKFGLEFAQNLVYFLDKIVVQRIIHIQKPHFEYEIVWKERIN